MTEKQQEFIIRILRERQRQDDKWGSERDQHPAMWLTILSEEVGEVAQEICESGFAIGSLSANYEKELIQVAAVALAALENIEKYKK